MAKTIKDDKLAFILTSGEDLITHKAKWYLRTDYKVESDGVANSRDVYVELTDADLDLSIKDLMNKGKKAAKAKEKII